MAIYSGMPSRFSLSTAILAAVFVIAGAMHFVIPASYERIVPEWLPNATLLVQISGVAEILGGIGLLVPNVRRYAGIGLIALLVAVFPANVEMLRLALADDASFLAEAALWLRLPLQPVLIWWVWRVTLKRGLVRGLTNSRK
jgi:uncharacterized membrane protein